MSDASAEKQERFLATPEQYLAFEEQADHKHEWWDGEVIAMPGMSDRHGIINADVIGEVRSRLKGGPCVIRTGDVRVRTPIFRRQEGQRGLYTYPDATVVCGKAEYDPLIKDGDTITNPTLLIEVLSPSTAHNDRHRKFGRYQTIDAFREYVLIEQDEPCIQVFFRRDNGDWKIRVYDRLDAVARLDSIDVDLPLAEVYANVDVDAGG
jgi:Uma2 family endonuclease